MTNKEALRRLGELGKSREWLKDATGYSINSLYNVFAGEERPLNDRMEKAFQTAFLNAEGPSPAPSNLPERITLEPSTTEFQAWDRASRIAAADSLQTWAVDALNQAADEWHRRQSTNYRNLKPLPPAMVAEDDGEKTSKPA